MSEKAALKVLKNGRWVAVPVLLSTTSGSGGGLPGEDGGYYLPTVSDGILSWQPSKADMPSAPSADVRGPKGDKGDPGQPGAPGDPGYTPQKGIDYFDGAPGEPGAPGRTPVRGTDYWTAQDKQAIVNDVLAALPVYNGEVADA